MKHCPMPQPDSEDLRPSAVGQRPMELFGKLMYFNKLQKKVMYRLVASREVFHVQMLYLTMISHYEGLSHSELAQRMGVERASATTAVQRMERAGLIRRAEDPRDQRLSRIYLTDLGRAMNEQTDREMGAYVNRCFDIDEAAADGLCHALDEIMERMKQFLSEDGPQDPER